MSGVTNSLTTDLGGQSSEQRWPDASFHTLGSIWAAAAHLQPIVSQRKCGPSFTRSSDFSREGGIMECFGEIYECLNVIN